MARPRKYGARKNHVEDIHARTFDALAKFQDFKDEILPKIRKMMKEGKKSSEIRAFAQAYLTGRQVTIALTSEKEEVALRAIDSLTHQNEGKPRERQEVEHRFSKLKDEELDSLLESRLKEAAIGAQEINPKKQH